MTRMPAEFTLTIQPPIDDDDFRELAARVSCRGFGGETAFTIARRDLDRFAAELDGVRRGTGHEAQLLGGWDAEERLRLRITPSGRSGQFIARVWIANRGPREDQWHRAETEFVCPPEALSGFLAGLGGWSDAAASTEASLVGDADATA